MRSTDTVLLVDEDGKVQIPGTKAGDILIYGENEGTLLRGEAIVGTVYDIDRIYRQGFHKPEQESVLRTNELHAG